MQCSHAERRQSRFQYVPWLLAGTAVLAVLVIVAWFARDGANPAQQLSSKASRADPVGRMQLDLASAAEAEKSAVLATTDDDSMTFADAARARTAALATGIGGAATCAER